MTGRHVDSKKPVEDTSQSVSFVYRHSLSRTEDGNTSTPKLVSRPTVEGNEGDPTPCPVTRPRRGT